MTGRHTVPLAPDAVCVIAGKGPIWYRIGAVEVHGLAVLERRDAEVVVGPPDDVDVLPAGLLEMRGEAREALAERTVNVHRHADRPHIPTGRQRHTPVPGRLRRGRHRGGGERGAGGQYGTSGQRVVHIP
ncbi:hypothetical protein ACPPVO_50515 [Dactylosporangium sp. McL0621]|uniref:hypothetical protein n=1 Tax=Dactylosporangium sp. McL0621 TaxID=3415678 RepID=UPI003CEF1D1F